MVGFKKDKRGELLFLTLALALPLLQFIIFYLVVNFNSILLSFQEYQADGTFKIIGFQNFQNVITDLVTDELTLKMFANTFITLAVTLADKVLVFFFAYLIYKKLPGHKFFSVILFLPSLIPGFVLSVFGSAIIKDVIPKVLENPELGGVLYKIPQGFYVQLLWMILMSFGSSLLLFLGGMSSIDASVVEYAQVDGVNALQELIHIILPGVYPTFVTVIIIALTTTFSAQGYLFNFYGLYAEAPFRTVGYYIYTSVLASKDATKYPYISAMGLLLTIVWTPIVIGLRKAMEKLGPSEE